MSIRRLFASVLAGSLILVCLVSAGCGGGRTPKHVVLICIDTVRYDTWWLPRTAGWTDPMKRWDDRLVRLDHVQSAAPWTVPSVASVFTGNYPTRHGAGRFEARVADLTRMQPSILPASMETLAEKLSAKGWKTGAIIAPSWVNPETGLLQGFSEIRSVPASSVTKAALEWMRGHGSDDPSYLYVHYMDAHGDQAEAMKLTMAQSLTAAQRSAALRAMPPDLCSDPSSVHCIEYLSYVRSIIDLRKELASLMDGLERDRRLDDTIVAVFSDHGEEFGEHAAEEKALGTDPEGSYGFGHGRSMYQELLHVPVFVWHPRFPARAVSSAVSLIDIAPTILEWVGVEHDPSRWQGISFAELDSLDKRSASDRPLLSSGIAFGPEQFGVVFQTWKRIEITCPPGQVSYQLDRDPQEKNALAATRLDQKMAAMLDDYRSSAATGEIRQTQLTKASIESLRAIGYLQGSDAPARKEVSCTNQAAGYDSIGAFDPGSHAFFLRKTNTSGVADVLIPVDREGMPLVGDWYGTGVSVVALFVPARSEFSLYPGNLARAPDKTIVLRVPEPSADDLPVAGDWNGDGIQTVGIYRPSTSTFYLRNTNTSGPPDLVIAFGVVGDKPVAGDWTGDQRTKIGVFRPSMASFFLRQDLGRAEKVTSVTFGIPGDLPVAGDWDGDGKDTIGVYRPSMATYFLRNRNDTGNADLTVTFGRPGLLPLTGDWAR